MSRFSVTQRSSRPTESALAALRGDLERNHGLQRSFGVRRIIVPFFGGADDRAAVEFLRKVVLSSAGTVQGLVITFASSDSSNAGLADGPIAKPNLKPTAMHMENMTADDEHIRSINLQTIHQQEAARVDARFIFTSKIHRMLRQLSRPSRKNLLPVSTRLTLQSTRSCRLPQTTLKRGQQTQASSSSTFPRRQKPRPTRSKP